MLSTSIIKNVSDAGHYYTAKDNYYTAEEGIEQSEWYGKGTTKLNLQGEINTNQFTSLLKGELPNGEIIGKVVDGIMHHRAGWDLTFSAPKSVSIMALLAGDKRLLDAHRNAVKVVLSEIERGCSEVRVKTQGETSYHHTKNIVAALFHHDLSRAEDPQLHTHSVIMNLTERADGLWRSMASKLGRYDKETTSEVHGFIERVRNNKRFYGKMYETELAYQVQQLGYEITTDEKTGVFQIKGIAQDVLDFFSKRRQKIEKHLKDHGLSGQNAAEIAALHTRENKNNVDRENLFKRWNIDAKRLGFNGESLIKQSEGKFNLHLEPNKNSIEFSSLNNIRKSINGIIQFKSTFTLEDVFTETSTIAMNEKINVKNILNAVDVLIEKGELLSLESAHGKSFFMAKATLDDEKRIQTFLNSKKTLYFSGITEAIDKFISKNNSITPLEETALNDTFSNEKNTLIEGQYAKEFLSKAIVEIANAEKLTLSIVSPNQITSKQLALDLKKDPETIWGKIKSLFVDTTIKHFSTMNFLNQNTDKSPDILLIDNAHLLSAREQADLLEWGDTKNTKVIFFSQKNLLLSQKKGVDTDYLIKHGISSVTLAEKNNLLRQDISKHDMTNVMKKMAANIIDVPEQDARLHAMASHFSRLNDHKNTFLVGNNKGTVETLNQFTHDELKQAGKLKQGISINALIPVFVSDNRQHQLTSYPVGHLLRFNENNKLHRIPRGEYLHVIGHDQKQQEILLKRPNGKVVRWKPDQRVEVFKEEQREWSIGERLQSHRSMKSVNVAKGEYFTVNAIRGNIVKLTRERGKSIFLDISKAYHKHFDYGYAATPHNLAHQKVDYFIADLTATAFTTDQRRFFQLISQPEKISIYTDDAKTLLETLDKKSGNKLTAHAILQSSEDVKKNLTDFYRILQEAIQRPGENEIILSKRAVDAVDYAIRHLAERNAGFTHKDLLEVAMGRAMGGANREHLLQAVQAMEKAGIILRGKDNNGTLWTTQEAIKIERNILALSLQDKGILQPIASDDVIQQYCENKILHAEQIAAIKTIVQSRDRVLVIQGRAGTGKTTMMASLADVLSAKEFLGDQGYSLQGIAPTHKGVKELRSRGILAQTIDSFLLDMRQLQENKTNHDFSRTILIVDEASMVSNRKMLDVLSVTHVLNFRQAIPTGDTPQLASIEAGKPHDLMQRKLDPDVIYLEDIRRQKNPILKEAVKSIYKGDVAKTFSTLGNYVVEISDENDHKKNADKIDGKKEGINNEDNLSYQTRVKAIVQDYLQLVDKNEDVQIITPSHEDRKAVNNEVRHQLDAKGLLGGENHSFSVLVSKDMTGVERSDAINFKPEQIIRFTTSAGKNIKAGDYFTIKSTDSEHNLLVLNQIDDKSKEIIWQIPSSSKRINNMVEVFKRDERNLKIGDKIVWVRTNRKEGTLSSDFACVTHIEDGKITVNRSDNSIFTFDGKEEKYQHWDHAYAITAYGAQGGTYSTVLALFESYRKNLMNLKTFLVTLTRAENNLRIYTDNKEKLIDRIYENKGDKLSSLEVIGQYPQPSKNREKAVTTTEISLSRTQELPTKIRKPTHSISSRNPAKAVKFTYDIERIKEGLNQNAEQLAIAILGQPKVRGGNYIKFGSKQGSLSLTIKGEKTGWWNDFSDSNSKGRSMLSFLEKQCSMSKYDAIEYAAKWLGIAPNDRDKSIKNKSNLRGKEHHKAPVIETEHQRKMLARAQKIAKESIPIHGTLAETYLKQYRGIDIDKTLASEDIRFHPGIYSAINKQNLPALIAIVRNKNADIISVEAVFLDQKTGNKAENLAVGKQTFGPKKGGSVLVHMGDSSQPTILVEGVVTGLSVAKAIPNATVKSVLGKQFFAHIDPDSLPKKVIFCLDFDGKDLKIDKTIRDAATRLEAHNKQVHFMVPTDINANKYDYNDVLKLKGTPPIQLDFKNATSYQNFYKENKTLSQILKDGVKVISRELDNAKITANLHQKSISTEDISRFATKINKNLAHKNQKINLAYESINNQKPIENTPEINSKAIQIERDI